MVLYELMVMVKSATPRAQLADILRRAGTRVLDAGGVITDITSFGTRPLAYEFKSPGERHFEVRVVDRSVRRCGPSRRSPPRRARVSGGTHPQAAIFPPAKPNNKPRLTAPRSPRSRRPTWCRYPSTPLPR